ncbi:MAG: outer membrane beta-barrel protein [Opitutaceae bacterium]|jgi:outer membrane protein W
MNSNIKIAAVAAFFAIGVSAYAQQGFFRPEVAYVLPATKIGYSEAKLKGAAGYGVAGGAVFGAQDEHEIGLSLSMFNTNASESTAEPVNFAGTQYSSGSDSIKVKAMPVLLNYRYYFGAKTDTTRFYVGPSIGFTHMKGTETLVGNRPGGIIDILESGDTSNGFSGALSLGVAVKLADKTDLDIGYRYFYSKAFDGNFKANNLYTGITFKF